MHACIYMKHGHTERFSPKCMCITADSKLSTHTYMHTYIHTHRMMIPPRSKKTPGPRNERTVRRNRSAVRISIHTHLAPLMHHASFRMQKQMMERNTCRMHSFVRGFAHATSACIGQISLWERYGPMRHRRIISQYRHACVACICICTCPSMCRCYIDTYIRTYIRTFIHMPCTHA
jgi:hypothetical protein